MNEAAFLSALHESPNDEVTWLALADWLDEDGQAERAELVRLVRQLRNLPALRRTKQRARMEERVAALLLAGVRPVVPEVTNSLGMRFALVPPGTFLMGSPRGEPSHQSREHRHEVTLTRAFYLGVFPVTQTQYQSVTGKNPSHFRRRGGGDVVVAGLETGDFCVESVSWEDAVRFCARLTERESKHSRQVYRLPSEAEWEYACRAGGISTAAFHVGASLDSSQANIKGPHPSGADKGPYLARTCAVGSYPPNALGLYDMHGQVWEWCSDWLSDGDTKPVADPVGAAHGTYRILRGGNWRANSHECRTAYRGGGNPDTAYDHVGFRIACGLADRAPESESRPDRGRRRTTR